MISLQENMMVLFFITEGHISIDRITFYTIRYHCFLEFDLIIST